MPERRRRGVRRDDPELARLASDLAKSLRALQRELEPRRRGLAPPSPRTLLRFTDEVAIPAAILVLETNVRTLELLQRTIRLTDTTDRRDAGDPTRGVPDRVARLGESGLARLDAVLSDLDDALEGRPDNDDARRLLDDARELRAEIDDRLSGGAVDGPTERSAADNPPGDASGESVTEVPIDVDAELRSIKDDVDAGDDETDG